MQRTHATWPNKKQQRWLRFPDRPNFWADPILVFYFISIFLCGKEIHTQTKIKNIIFSLCKRPFLRLAFVCWAHFYLYHFNGRGKKQKTQKQNKKTKNKNKESFPSGLPFCFSNDRYIFCGLIVVIETLRETENDIKNIRVLCHREQLESTLGSADIHEESAMNDNTDQQTTQHPVHPDHDYAVPPHPPEQQLEHAQKNIKEL